MQIASVGVSAAAVHKVIFGDEFFELFLDVGKLLCWELVLIQDNLGLLKVFKVGKLSRQQKQQCPALGILPSASTPDSVDILFDI